MFDRIRNRENFSRELFKLLTNSTCVVPHLVAAERHSGASRFGRGPRTRTELWPVSPSTTLHIPITGPDSPISGALIIGIGFLARALAALVPMNRKDFRGRKNVTAPINLRTSGNGTAETTNTATEQTLSSNMCSVQLLPRGPAQGPSRVRASERASERDPLAPWCVGIEGQHEGTAKS